MIAVNREPGTKRDDLVCDGIALWVADGLVVFSFLHSECSNTRKRKDAVQLTAPPSSDQQLLDAI